MSFCLNVLSALLGSFVLLLHLLPSGRTGGACVILLPRLALILHKYTLFLQIYTLFMQKTRVFPYFCIKICIFMQFFKGEYMYRAY